MSFSFASSLQHCLNRKPADGFCGYDAKSRNYDSPKNFEGKPLKIVPQTTYNQGAVIEVESVLTAHHKGHLQVSVCAGELSEDCFNANMLTFVEDVSGYEKKANVDVLHPERAHIYPAVGDIGTDSSITSSGLGMRFKHKFRLPANLVGEHVVLQWRYLTANSCNYADYDQYDWPGDNWWSPGLSECVEPLSKTGDGAPEQFWNCADVKIIGEGGETDPVEPVDPVEPDDPVDPDPEEPVDPDPVVDPPTNGKCRTFGTWAGLTNEWCEINCNWIPSNCPPTHCICDGSATPETPEEEDDDERHPKPKPTPTDPKPEPEPEDPENEPTPEPTEEPEPTVPAPPVEFSGSVAVMYFVAWGTYARDVQVADIDASKLTHINYAFANVSPDGRCILGDAYADVQKTFTAENSVDGVADTWDQPLAGNFNQLRKLKMKYPKVKTLISLGGWTWSDKFSAMAMTSAGRVKFVDSCIDFMELYGFDGK